MQIALQIVLTLYVINNLSLSPPTPPYEEDLVQQDGDHILIPVPMTDDAEDNMDGATGYTDYFDDYGDAIMTMSS